ncbi:polysialyltransferase family glycosyltransferase [Vibrio diazotrophicus]|uniref:polysialyltransferase family glycosyltransferase n=1 Tax=Vibrio diazotrophicus TaxID=685 RepID=UPI00142DDC5F|nr:hypothetical protein [Vibrio diazotrophicus]
MNNIFFVQSPLQLLSAISIAKKNSGKSFLFIRLARKGRDENNKQISNLIRNNLGLWEDIVNIKDYNSSLDNFLYKIRFFWYLKKRFGLYSNRVFIGDYRNFYYCLYAKMLASNSNNYILDDGATVVDLQINHFQFGKGLLSYFSSFKYRFIVGFFKSIFGFEVDDYPPNLYTSFNLGQYLYGKQKIEWEGERIKNKDIENVVYFFGSKYSEAGIISLHEERGLLERCYVYLSSSFNFDIFYVPHRDDSKEKIDLLESIGYKIKYLHMPAEEYFSVNDKVPCVISGFYTTCLYTLSSKYEIPHALGFNISPYISDKEKAHAIDGVYEYYKSNGIKVLNV